MKEYTHKQLSYLSKIKNIIVKKHKKCDGVGYIEEDKVIPCDCMKIFAYITELVYSNIPIDYWNLNLSDLEVDVTYKRLVNEYIKNIDNAMDQGLGMMFFSEERGIGKTSLICEIAKTAIVKRYNVYYQIMQRIVDSRFKEGQVVIERLKESDLIIIDEFDKVMMRKESNIPKLIENLFREIIPYNIPIIMGSNLSSEEEVQEKFGTLSLIKRSVKLIPMEGDDYSDKKQDGWMERLKYKNIDFFNENILNNAKEFYRNQSVADEKEFNELF